MQPKLDDIGGARELAMHRQHHAGFLLAARYSYTVLPSRRLP